MAALFFALFSISWVEADVRGAEQSVAHAYDTRANLVQLQSGLLDAETAVSGYVATSQDRFLTVYDAARRTAGEAQSRLSSDIGGDPEGMAELTEIRRLAAATMDFLERRRRGSAPAAIEPERATMTDLQTRISLLNQRQERLFTQARYERDVARRRLFRTVLLCGILGPLGALSMHILIAGRLVRRLRTVQENARRLALGLPLEPPPAGSDEIAALGQQLENAAYLLRERERDVLESEQRYRDLFDHAPVPYEETDREGVIRRFNQATCSLVKCTPEQLTGRHVWDFLSPDEQEPFRAAMKERIARGAESGPFECEYWLEDGTRINVEIRESVIRNDAGEVTGTVRSLLDVTERKLASVAARKVEQYAMELRNKNEQLAHALDAARSATVAKSRFLASVSHELRTPLNGIIGFSELLYDQKIGPLAGEQRDVLSDILSSARHLLELINNILDLSKVESGKMEFHAERHRIQDLVYEVRDVLRPLAEKKSLVLTVDAPANLVAQIDGSRYKQVLYNFLSNAIKFTHDGGSIRVRLAMEGVSSFRLEVEDTGIGIADDELPRLFQEFGQLPNSRKAGQGTGLGLALTRHIVEAQGGSVGLRSVPGRGSVFFAVLPLDAQATS